jgi:hypothetical protein
MIGGIVTIAKLSDGRYVLTSGGEEDEFKVYASDGTFLQSVGGRGQGPGEFVDIVILRTYGDKLHVFDLVLRRHTVFSSDFSLIATSLLQFNPGMDAVVISDSLTVVNALIYRGDHRDYMLHAVDRSGEIVQSIARIPGGFSLPINDFAVLRSLERSSSGGIWALHRTRYRLEEWSLDGTLLRTLVRRAPWFPDNPEPGGEMEDTEGKRLPANLWPAGVDVREDRSGRLWTLSLVPDRRWPSGVSRVSTGEGEYAMLVNRQLAQDTVVDVFDLETNTLFASARFDQRLWAFIGNDEIISSWYEEDGSSRVQVWRISLEQRERPQ